MREEINGENLRRENTRRENVVGWRGVHGHSRWNEIALCSR
jgi:hypothetical protein